MGPSTSNISDATIATFDQSLTRPPNPDIPIDQLMRAVEGVRPYVKNHLGRFGFFDEVDDVLQDIRIEAWKGTVRGSYRAVSGIKFDAWVQGIACNVCARRLQRNFARSTMPLVEQFESGFQGLMDIQVARVDDQVANHIWATDVLQIVKAHVTDRMWDLAVRTLTERKAALPSQTTDASARTRWHAVFVVRQMALTVSHALDLDPHEIYDLESLRTAIIGSLPNPLLQLIASDVVLPAVLGKARAAAIDGVAQETGVGVRYVKVQVGLVRNLILAAEEILRAGTGIEGTLIEFDGLPDNAAAWA